MVASTADSKRERTSEYPEPLYLLWHPLPRATPYGEGKAAVSILRTCPNCTIEFISIKLSAAKGEDEPGMMESTADVPHPIADAPLPQADAVFDAATTLATAMDMVDPPPLV
jgi:hypothetical protein